MLKFRATSSMKARQAAEAQRKALEEKLKMEWAWKPMAAVMNEKESDLVYWVPPLYTSNLLTSFSSHSSSMSSSLNSSPSSSFRRSSSIRRPSATISQGSPLRRRKLAQRRPKLAQMSPQQSIQEAEDEISLWEEEERRRAKKKADEKRGKEDATTDDDRESGIQDEYSSVDEDHPGHDSFTRTNYLKHSLKNLEKQKQSPKKREKFKHLPTLLKVVERLSRIYTLPMTPPPPMYGATTIQKQKEIRTSSVKKPRRPSVKVYRVPSTRSSLRKSKEEEGQEAQGTQPFYVITKNKTPFSNLQQRGSIRSRGSMSSDRTHIGLPTLTENELRNAHLEMILKILTNLYEEKITDQNIELSHLKSKLQLQEKVIKQTAHLVLDLKNQMRTLQARMEFNEELKKFHRKSTSETETDSSYPYHPLEPLVEETSEANKSNLSLNTIDGEIEELPVQKSPGAEVGHSAATVTNSQEVENNETKDETLDEHEIEEDKEENTDQKDESEESTEDNEDLTEVTEITEKYEDLEEAEKTEVNYESDSMGEIEIRKDDQDLHEKEDKEEDTEDEQEEIEEKQEEEHSENTNNKSLEEDGECTENKQEMKSSEHIQDEQETKNTNEPEQEKEDINYVKRELEITMENETTEEKRETEATEEKRVTKAIGGKQENQHEEPRHKKLQREEPYKAIHKSVFKFQVGDS